jgi:hypothetical protein
MVSSMEIILNVQSHRRLILGVLDSSLKIRRQEGMGHGQGSTVAVFRVCPKQERGGRLVCVSD